MQEAILYSWPTFCTHIIWMRTHPRTRSRFGKFKGQKTPDSIAKVEPPTWKEGRELWAKILRENFSTSGLYGIWVTSHLQNDYHAQPNIRRSPISHFQIRGRKKRNWNFISSEMIALHFQESPSISEIRKFTLAFSIQFRWIRGISSWKNDEFWEG